MNVRIYFNEHSMICLCLKKVSRKCLFLKVIVGTSMVDLQNKNKDALQQPSQTAVPRATSGPPPYGPLHGAKNII